MVRVTAAPAPGRQTATRFAAVLDGDDLYRFTDHERIHRQRDRRPGRRRERDELLVIGRRIAGEVGGVLALVFLARGRLAAAHASWMTPLDRGGRQAEGDREAKTSQRMPQMGSTITITVPVRGQAW